MKIGDYDFKGYIPGNYVIKFTYGDETQLTSGLECYNPGYNGQDYQSTKANPYTDQARYWYAEFDENNQYITDENGVINSNLTRYSDAYDEVKARREAIEYVRTESMNDDNNNMTINTHKADVLKSGSLDLEESLQSELAKNQQMTAYTSTLELEVEMAQRNQYYEAGTKYEIENIDFGLVKRAPSIVTIKKDLQHIKITQSDGTILIDTDVQIDEKTGNISFKDDTVSEKVHLQYIDTPNAYGVGIAKLEIDDEIIVGTIDITYKFTIEDKSPDTTLTYYYANDNIGTSNNSTDEVINRDDLIAIAYYKEEIEKMVYYENMQTADGGKVKVLTRIDKDGTILYQEDQIGNLGITNNVLYHNYSTNGNTSYRAKECSETETVVNKVDNIIDYVSNNLRFDSDKNDGTSWKLVDDNTSLINSGNNNLLADRTHESFKTYNQTILATENNELLKWLTESGVEEDNKKEGKECIITLSASNTQNVDLDYSNVVEFIQTDNTAGRVDTESTPGNLDPINDYIVEYVDDETIENYDEDSNVKTGYYSVKDDKYTASVNYDAIRKNYKPYELDSAKAQYVNITDSTGDTHYYYVLIGSMLAIFAVGIVGIKKFVLDEKK